MLSYTLTHLSQMDLPILFSRTSPFPMIGVFDGKITPPPQKKNIRKYCKQTVKANLAKGAMGRGYSTKE